MADNSATIAKKIILKCIADGTTIEEACKVAEKSVKSYEYYRRTDKVFAEKVDRTRQGLRGKSMASEETAEMDFFTFRERYLHSKTFPHQRNLIDVIEGRDPSWLHESMKWEPSQRNRIMLNIPPNHAKSMTVTIDYATWLICQNPNFRILIVSQTHQLS